MKGDIHASLEKSVTSNAEFLHLSEEAMTLSIPGTAKTVVAVRPDQGQSARPVRPERGTKFPSDWVRGGGQAEDAIRIT